MIKRFRYGLPLQTDSVILNIPVETTEIPYFTMEDDSLILALEKQDKVFGLGENVRGIDKRGWVYISNCTDDPIHTENKHSLYAAHNFLIVDGQKKIGVFLDTPEKVVYDIGYTHRNQMIIQFPEKNVDIYIIEEEHLLDIVRELRQLTGKSYCPPRWAFGYGQSRWGYNTADDVREVVAQYRKREIPLESVYLDIDYMDQYKSFTVKEEAFPDFAEFVQEMKEQNIRLIPIIDAGIKIQKGYSVYEEGVKNNYFCKKEDGSDYVAAVWPGKVHLPDVLNPEAREWFGNQYQVLLEAGIEGFWNDMNEPAIFYTPEHLSAVFEKLHEYENMELDINTFFAMKCSVLQLDQNPEDFQMFYHQMPEGRIRHDRVHNLYGYYLTRAAQEAFLKLRPGKRTMLFSRASCIGMHRYSGIWTGDNASQWVQLLMNIKMMPSLNMCGFLYSGADIGGFGDDTTEDLLLRWLEFGIFMPLMRNHTTTGTRRQELYAFDNETSCGNMVRMRYALLSYLYSEYMKAYYTDGMYFMPLSFVYENDERARGVEDQLLVGESIMIAPVYEQNAVGRYVYLPETMKMLRFRSPEDYDEVVMEQGDHFISVKEDEVLIFLRLGHLLLLSEGGMCTEEAFAAKRHTIGFGTGTISYQLYEDDGEELPVDAIENHLSEVCINI